MKTPKNHCGLPKWHPCCWVSHQRRMAARNALFPTWPRNLFDAGTTSRCLPQPIPRQPASWSQLANCMKFVQFSTKFVNFMQTRLPIPPCPKLAPLFSTHDWGSASNGTPVWHCPLPLWRFDGQNLRCFQGQQNTHPDYHAFPYKVGGELTGAGKLRTMEYIWP